MGEPERRRNYFIKKDFQRNFIVKFCLLVLAGSFISGAIIYAMSKAAVATTFINSRLTIRSAADFILPAVLLAGAVVVVCVGAAAIIIVLFTSHKIAGPLYRLEQDAQELAKGNLKVKFHLRQGDEIAVMAQRLACATESLRAKVNSAKNSFAGLKKSLAPFEAQLSKEIKEKLEQLEKALCEFDS